MSRRKFRHGLIAALFSSAVAIALVPLQGRSGEAPNLLFVLADQWRAQALGHAGDPNVRTPHLDTLLRQSAYFMNAVSSVPVCCPARASFMTGQRALTHGVFLNDVPLNRDAVTLPKILRAAGYDTGYIGKWHLNGDGRSAFIPPDRRQGFDYWKALECTHDYNQSFYYSDTPEKLKWDGYDAVAQSRDAQRYLRAHARAGKPFFLFLAWGPPHDPYQTAPQKYREQYQADPFQLHNLVNEPGHASHQRDLDARLAHKLQQTGDYFLSAEDYEKKWGYTVDANGTVPYTP